MKKLILFMLMAPLTIGCNSQGEEGGGEEEDIKEHEYSEVADKKIEWEDIFNKREKEYFVYFYSESCQNCFLIKNEVIQIALKNKKMIYFCNDKNTIIKGYNLELTIGVKNVENLFINGFPDSIKITNNSVSNNVCGRKNVLEMLRD